MPKTGGIEWNETQIACLREGWAKGDSASTISREIGCSKGAVIGKSHRLKLPPRPSPIKPLSDR